MAQQQMQHLQVPGFSNGSRHGSTNNNGNGESSTTSAVEGRQLRQRRRSRQRDRLPSNASSVVSAAAATLPTDDSLRISNTEALIHMVKAAIGGGFLAIPEAFHNAGWLVGTLGILFIGLAILNTMVIIVNCSQALRTKYRFNGEGSGAQGRMLDLPDTVYGVFLYGARGRFAWLAPYAKRFTTITLFATYYGVNIYYVCIVSNTIKQLVDQTTELMDHTKWPGFLHGLSIRWYPAISAIFIIPLGMVRLIKYMVKFSVAANVCLTVGCGVVFYYLFTSSIAISPEDMPRPIVWPITRWSLFAGSSLASIESVGMLLHIENAMREPSALVNSPSFTLHWAMAIIIALNGSMGLLGYLKYGDTCAGSISLNLPARSWLSNTVKIVIAIGVVLTYSLQLTVSTDISWRWFRNMLYRNENSRNEKNPKPQTEETNGGTGVTNGRENDDTMDESFENESTRLTIYYYLMRLMLILGTILVATVAPNIGPIVSLVGSLGFSTLGLMMPVLMNTLWHWYPDNEDWDMETNNGSMEAEEGRQWSENRSEPMGTSLPPPPPYTLTPIPTPTPTPTSTPRFGNASTPVLTTRLRVRRVLRHIKNIAILVLAVFSAIGGVYYNIHDIISTSS